MADEDKTQKKLAVGIITDIVALLSTFALCLYVIFGQGEATRTNAKDIQRLNIDVSRVEKQQQEGLQKVAEELKSQRQETRQTLDKIDTKIDRLIDRQLDGNGHRYE